MLPRVSRLGPAADDELLLLVELQLPPRRAAAARLVRRLPVLDDEPFPSFLQRARVQRAAVALDLLADADRARLRLRSAEQSFEAHAALDERQAAQIVLPLAQQIERDEGDRLLAVDRARRLSRRSGESCPGAAGIPRADLSHRARRSRHRRRAARERLRRTRRARPRWRGTATSSRCRGATTAHDRSA